MMHMMKNMFFMFALVCLLSARMAMADVVLFNPDDFGDQASWGAFNEWVPAGSSVTASNGRILSDVTYTSQTHSFAVDFNTGAADQASNLSQSQIWSSSVALPASGVNAFQVVMRAPAGTAINFIFGGTSNEGSQLIQTVDNDWEVFYVPFSSFSPAVNLSSGGTVQNIYFKLFGAGSGGVANLSGTIYLASMKLVEYYPPTQAVDVNAANRTITVDGDASDWDLTASEAIHMVNALAPGSDDPMELDICAAWDNDYLYFLIQEGGAATAQNEATQATSYTQVGASSGPWFYDGVSLWVSLDVSTMDQAAQYGFNPWMGFSSTGQTDLLCARVNDVIAASGSTMDTASLVGASVATGGSFAQHNRVIEARFKWTSLAAVVETTRQPGGDLMAAVASGLKIGVQPLMIQNDYNGQYFLNGTAGTAPSGWDSASRNVVLSSVVPVELSGFCLE